MVTKVQTEYDRITFTLPSSVNDALDALKNEISRSKSEIIKLAIESYLDQQKKLKVQRAVALMVNEYENDADLTAFTSIDSDDFV